MYFRFRFAQQFVFSKPAWRGRENVYFIVCRRFVLYLFCVFYVCINKLNPFVSVFSKIINYNINVIVNFLILYL